jgi:hypothetical protein
MDQPKFYEIIGRALVDTGFRDRLLDPKSRPDALAEHGVSTGDDTHKALEDAIGAVDRLAKSTGPGVVAS